MENSNNTSLFENSLLIFPDIEQILNLNNIFLSDNSNNIKLNYNWNILSKEFCDFLEFFSTNKSNIFSCFNLFSKIQDNKNTFIYQAFEFLNLLTPEKISEKNLEYILNDFEIFLNNKLSSKAFSKEEVYLSILLILYIFLQESVTGSSFMFIKESEKTDYKKDLEKFTENYFLKLENSISENLKIEFYEYLTVNGESPYNNIKLIFFFILSHKIIIKSEIFSNFEVNKLWRARILHLHDKMLKDQTPTIKDSIFTNLTEFKIENFENLYSSNLKLKNLFFDPKDFNILQGLLKLEKSYICLRYYQYKECKVLIEDSKNLFGLNINLTGKYGRKTKYQVFDVPILVVESTSTTLDKSKELVPEKFEKPEKNEVDPENKNNEEIEEPTGIPKQILLNKENPMLETPNITDEIKLISTELSLYDQIYVTSLLNSLKYTFPDEDLLREVILTYVNKSIEKSYDWLVFSKLLLHKSLAEEKKTKTIERSLLQIESLCLQYNDRLPNSFSRMKYLFTVDYPYIWNLKKFYAEMFMNYGAFITAFDLFEELNMYEECVNCLYLAGKNERALEFANEIIKSKKDPGIYCILGELLKDEEYFHKALEISNNKYTRAYRCLGKFKLVEKK